MSQELANKLQEEFEMLTKIKCKATYMEKGKNHKPTPLPNGFKGVYVFLLNENICFKVGKANSNSKARWNSHHYCLDKSIPSTFTKSLLKNIGKIENHFNSEDIINFKNILNSHEITSENFKEDIKNLSKELDLKNWIKNNISRIEFLIEKKDNDIDFDTNLLEALVQFRLKPIFEGKNS